MVIAFMMKKVVPRNTDRCPTPSVVLCSPRQDFNHEGNMVNVPIMKH